MERDNSFTCGMCCHAARVYKDMCLRRIVVGLLLVLFVTLPLTAAPEWTVCPERGEVCHCCCCAGAASEDAVAVPRVKRKCPCAANANDAGDEIQIPLLTSDATVFSWTLTNTGHAESMQMFSQAQPTTIRLVSTWFSLRSMICSFRC